MSSFTSLSDPADFADGFFINWFEHPDGPLSSGTTYTIGTNRYDFGDQVITLDVSGPPLELSVCNPSKGVRGQFQLGNPVVLADCHATQKPLRLLFDPPVRAVGAFVGAEGIVGSVYDAVLHVHDQPLGEGHGRNVRATLSNAVKTAPFVALKCKGGSLISEAWFDVISASASDQFTRVAIGPLYYLP